MHHFTALLCFAAISTLEASSSCGIFRFANNYGDHMVLQRSPTQAIIWGYAERDGVEVTISLTGQTVRTSSLRGPTGSIIWEAHLVPVCDHGPYTITASTSTCSTTLEDVLFGDVWVCSGQSNMYMPMRQIDEPNNDIEESVNFTNVRTFYPRRECTDTPREEIRRIHQPWGLPTPERVRYFSAVCWLFGRNLYRKYGRPIGLIQVAQGGSRIEAWSSPAALEKCFENGVATQSAQFNNPSWLWNALIAPLLKMPIYGVAWYQGESNKYNRLQYGCALSAMIDDWRSQWYSATGGLTQRYFPIGQVQLAAREISSNTATSELRWQQTCFKGFTPNECLPNVFTAIAMDLPDVDSPYGAVHPRYKRPVADRLSLAAYQYAYGDSSEGRSQGPFPTSFRKSDKRLIIRYDGEEETIVIRNLDNFQVFCSMSALNRGKWIDAKVTYIDLPVELGLHVGCGNDEHVTGVRYAWSESPCQYMECAVYSTTNDLPAPSFIFNLHFPENETILIEL